LSEAVVRYKFVATGADSIVAAFKGISRAAEDSAVRVQRAQSRSMPGGGAGGGGSRSRGNDVAKLAERVARDQEKAAQREARAVEAAERAKTRAVEREAARRAAISARAARAESVAIDRSKREFDGRAWRTAGRVGSGIVTYGGAAMAAAAGVAGLAANKGFKADEIARRIAANAMISGDKPVDSRALRQTFFDVAKNTPGQTAEGIGEAALSFQGATGMVADADTLQKFATIASGAGASIDDIAQAAAALSNNLNIKKVDDMAEALSSLAVQGAKGQFELKDAAALMGKVSAAAAGANWDKSVGGVRSLGGLLQVARMGGGGREDAVTAVENVFRNLSSKEHYDRFKKAGVDTFVKGSNRRELRNVNDVLVETFQKTKGDRAVLSDLFGAQSAPIINKLSDVFNTAMKESGGNVKVAGEAVRKALTDAANVSNSYATIQKAAAAVQETAGNTLAKNWESLAGKLSDKLLPAISGMVDTLDKSGAFDAVIDGLTVLADAFSETAQTLRDLGLISAKRKDPGEEYLAASKGYAKAGKRMDAAAFAKMTPEEINQAMLEYSQAGARFYTAKNAVFEKPQTMSVDKFAEAYAAATGGDVGFAKSIGKRIAADPQSMRDNATLYAGETEEARRIRTAFLEQQVQERGQVSSVLGGQRGQDVQASLFTGDIAGAFAAISEAAKGAAANLKQIDAAARPSIIAGG